MILKIGFSTGNSIISFLIRQFLHTPFSHTYLRFQQADLQEESVFQAVDKGLQFLAVSRFLEQNKVIKEFELQISKEQYVALLNKCHQAAGLKYGYFQNIGDGLVRFLQHLGISLKRNPLNDGINCSEWVTIILRQLDSTALSDIKDINLVTPKDVYNYLLKKVD